MIQDIWPSLQWNTNRKLHSLSNAPVIFNDLERPNQDFKGVGYDVIIRHRISQKRYKQLQ